MSWRPLVLLVVLAVTALGACGSGRGDTDKGDTGSRDTGSDATGGGDGEAAGDQAEAELTTNCPTAEDIGARLGVAVELNHRGGADLGQPAELVCNYDEGYEGHYIMASRVRWDSADTARHWFELDDFTQPDALDPPTELDHAETLDVGDAGYFHTNAELSDPGEYYIAVVARVRVGASMCAVDFEDFDEPSPELRAAYADTTRYLVSALCSG